MQTVSHHGRDTAYRHARPEAAGPTALYVHGSGGNHRLWAGQYGPRGPTHPAVALDLAGHGSSPDVDTEPGPETLSAYAADVVAVARETGATVLVGNSLGGAVVQRVLLDGTLHPEAAVLAGTGAKLAVIAALRDWLAEDFDRAIEFLHEPGRLFLDPTPERRAASVEAMRDTGRAVTRRDFLTCHEFDVRDDLADVDVPTLALVGEADELTPVTYHEYLAETLPNCTLRVLSDAAHLAMVERAAAFNEAIGDFLQAL